MRDFYGGCCVELALILDGPGKLARDLAVYLGQRWLLEAGVWWGRTFAWSLLAHGSRKRLP